MCIVLNGRHFWTCCYLNILSLVEFCEGEASSKSIIDVATPWCIPYYTVLLHVSYIFVSCLSWTWTYSVSATSKKFERFFLQNFLYISFYMFLYISFFYRQNRGEVLVLNDGSYVYIFTYIYYLYQKSIHRRYTFNIRRKLMHV